MDANFRGGKIYVADELADHLLVSRLKFPTRLGFHSRIFASIHGSFELLRQGKISASLVRVLHELRTSQRFRISGLFAQQGRHPLGIINRSPREMAGPGAGIPAQREPVGVGAQAAAEMHGLDLGEHLAGDDPDLLR